MSTRCVIVGAGHGAAQLCASLAAAKWDGCITLIGEEPHLPYHRPALSKTQLDPEGDHALQLIRPEDFYHANRVEFLSGTIAERIDRTARCVEAGGRSIAYDKLVLCTGSIHRLPPIAGMNLPGVFTLRTAADAAGIRHAVAAASRVVVIGGGFIGLEVAASLRKRGCGVAVLELADRVLARVTSPAVSDFFETLHRGRGVDLRTGIGAREIRKSEGGMEVVVSDESTIACDAVVIGTGAAPNTSLAEEAGLHVDNGIRVDAWNVSSDPDIFALGDCCSQHHPLYDRVLRLESVQNALEQAKTVAGVLTGHPRPHDALPWFWSHQYDVKLQIAGVSHGYDAVVIRGIPEPGASFSAWYFRNGGLLAVDAVNDAAAYATGTKLLKLGARPDPDRLKDSSVSLKEILQQAKETEHA